MTVSKKQQAIDRINQKLTNLDLNELNRVNHRIGRATNRSKGSKPIYNKVWFWGLIIFIILLFPLCFYIANFWNEQLGSKEEFAQFGDFLAGSSGVLMAFCNVLAFIWLTNTIAKAREKTEDDKKNLEKRINKINIQYDSYNKIIDLFATLVPPMTTNDYDEEYKKILIKKFNVFATKLHCRMDSLGKANSNPIFKPATYEAFESSIIKYGKFLKKSKTGDFDNYEKAYKEFKENRDKFLVEVYEQIEID